VRPQILFIQGGGSGAHKEDKRLVAALRKHLGSTYEVHYPKMPKESDPDYQRWRPQIRKELTSMKGNVISVGHSLGGSFLLKCLSGEKIERQVVGLFLIATPYRGGDGWRYEGYEAVALPEDFPSRLPKGTPMFFYHSPRWTGTSIKHRFVRSGRRHQKFRIINNSWRFARLIRKNCHERFRSFVLE